MRVYVGLSGGVDSAVSAALLKQQGHNVIGCFIKIWQPEFLECTWREDRFDAIRVCAALGIPFKEIDLSEKYKREVVEEMIADYSQGITPNPDVLCNRSIKFGHFLQWALSQGADSIATGHYARRRETDPGRFPHDGFRKSIIMDLRNPSYELLRGKDPSKDQSYFLWQLGQHELSKTIFPIGDLTKQEVRSLAKKFGLPNADKPDSQGLCFVGDVSMAEFLGRFIPLSPGPVVTTAGVTAGEHVGAARYTIGQRHGFCGAESAPQYVVSIDIGANTIMVSPRRSDAERSRTLLRDIHWTIEEPTFPLHAEVQTRYRDKTLQVVISRNSAGIVLSFEHPHLVAPGQSAVMYEGERLLGGGVICAARDVNK